MAGKRCVAKNWPQKQETIIFQKQTCFFITLYWQIKMRAKKHCREQNYHRRQNILLSLPASIVIELYLNYQHKLHHKGVQYIRNEIQNMNFWLVQRLRRSKNICVRCRLFSRIIQPDCDLPVDRVTSDIRPFLNSGVDYFGEFEVKLFRPSVKKWACLFTWLSVRAVYLEMVDSLNTATCIHSVQRFAARSGQPKSLI